MLVLAVLFCAVAFLNFYFVGHQLMPLVLVQVVEDLIVRANFSCSFACSIFLFFISLLGTAFANGYWSMLSGILFGSANSSITAEAVALRRHRFLTEAFEWVLMALLINTLVLAPVLLVRGFLRSAADRSHRQRQLQVQAKQKPWKAATSFVFSFTGLVILLLIAFFFTWLHLGQQHSSSSLNPSHAVRPGAYTDEQGHAIANTSMKSSRSLWQRAWALASGAVQQANASLHRMPAEIVPRGTASVLAVDGGTHFPKQSALDVPHEPPVLPSAGGSGRLLRGITSRVAVAGVALMGILAGSAAITTPYGLLSPLLYWRGKEASLSALKTALNRQQLQMLDLYAARQQRIAQEVYSSQREPKGPAGAGSSTTRNSRSLMSRLRVECEGIRSISTSLFVQMNEVDAMMVEVKRGMTWSGKVYAVCGLVLALYSFSVVVLTIANLALFRYSDKDPVTRAVNFLESVFVLQRRDGTATGSGWTTAATTTTTMMSHGLGREDSATTFSVIAMRASSSLIIRLALVVSGWMVAASIRGVLLTIFQLTLSSSVLITADITAVGLAILMGTYFVGQLVMLRVALPRGSATSATAPSPSGVGGAPSVLVEVLGELPVYYYQRLYEFCFLFGCGVTAIAQRFALNDPVSSAMTVVGTTSE